MADMTTSFGGAASASGAVTAAQVGARAPDRGYADVLAVGFGTTVAMWACGYFCRLFGDAVPAPLLFVVMIGCLLVGGLTFGRFSRRSLGGAAVAGLITGGVNLLIIGSLISGNTPNEIRAGALLWVPGTLVACVVLMTLGAGAGRVTAGTRELPDWPGIFGWVAVVATFVLLAAGGLVTGFDEGLAVVDWPNSQGYNMFLYPLAKMTGGVYLEHAHRLLGTLVGLTTLVLALHVRCTESNRRLRTLAWAALAGVVVQGILGGLRVTGHFTLSTDPGHTNPSILLAIVHGVFGQVVFGLLVALAVARSEAWRVGRTGGAATLEATPGQAPFFKSADTDRSLATILAVMLILQLVLGAFVRHFTWALGMTDMRYGLGVPPEKLQTYGTTALHLHITIAVLTALLTVAVGIRGWGLYQTAPRVKRLGLTLLTLVGLQLALGLAAMIVVGNDRPDHRPQVLDVAITTTHQVVGAALLALAIMLGLWFARLRGPRGQAPA